MRSLKKVIVNMVIDVTSYTTNNLLLMKKLNGKRFMRIIDKLSII